MTPQTFTTTDFLTTTDYADYKDFFKQRIKTDYTNYKDFASHYTDGTGI